MIYYNYDYDVMLIENEACKTRGSTSMTGLKVRIGR